MDWESGLVDQKERGVEIDQEPGLVRGGGGGGRKMDWESGLVDRKERGVEIDQDPGLVWGGGGAQNGLGVWISGPEGEGS